MATPTSVTNSTTVATSTTTQYAVQNGGTLTVASSGNVTSTLVSNGGKLVVSGGTETSATVYAGATETVSKGSASGDLIYGVASGISGGTAVFTNETVENGGILLIANGNTAAGTVVSSGGTLILSGNNGAVTGTVLSGGGTLELDSPKANISGTLTFLGGNNDLDIAVIPNAGTGDLATITGFSSTDKIDVTLLNPNAGSSALSFASSGGNELVTVSGAGGSEVFIFAGTTTYTSTTLGVISSGGHEYVEYSVSGFVSSASPTTSVTSTTASGAYTETSGHTLLVLSGGSVSAPTIQNSAFLTINGGTDTGAIISAGGTETVSAGAASKDLIFGNAAVDTGVTVTSETVENGGFLFISLGAVDSAATISSGGNETIIGSANGDLIYGTQLVSGATAVVTNETVYSGGNLNLFLKGGIVSAATISSGGFLNINGNAVASNTTLVSGGTIDLESPKANLAGSLTFSGGGNSLLITDTTSAGYGDAAIMSGFSSTDVIDITSAAFAGSALTLSESVVSGNLVVNVLSAGTAVETFTFAGTALSGGLTLVTDGNGGEDLKIVPTSVTTTVTSPTASAYTENATDTLLVLNGGSVSGATIENGGFLVVNGGTDTAAQILTGGLETVSAGTATGDKIFGSAIVSGGVVSSETVAGGGKLTIEAASASNITLGGSGTVDLASATSELTGSLTFSGGYNTLQVDAISNTGFGDQAVISGFSVDDKIDVTGIAPGASLTFATNGSGDSVATITGTGGSESFTFADASADNASTMTLVSDGKGGVDLVLKATPVVTLTSLSGTTTNASDPSNTVTQTNTLNQIINGKVDVVADPEAVGTTVSVYEGKTVIGTATVDSNGYWSASATLLNADGANVVTASDTDTAGDTGTTAQSLTYNVNTSAAAFTAGNLVISISGDGDGSGNYGDNQAGAITLEQLTTSGSYVSQLVLPQTTTTNADGTTEYAISGEYGSSSEGTLELSADGHSLVIGGYGVNAATYNAGGAAVYGNAALAQTTSVQGGQYTAVPRVIADISANGTVDTSTALYNVYNENNIRSVATVNGSSFYVTGQGIKGDTTQGVFYAQDGASSATPIDTSTDARTAELYNGELYVSRDSTQGTGGTSNISSYGTSAPTGATAGTILPGISQSVTLSNGNGNSINGSTGTVALSPENFYFANSTTLYIADGGNPKEGTDGDGGLQKWSLVNGTWQLDYTLSAGLNLIQNPSVSSDTSGTTGLIGLTGEVVNGQVELFATNSTIGDLDQTYLFGITDTLSDTTAAQASGESFTILATAAPDTNIRGVAFAPTEATACYCLGTLILTDKGEAAVETLAIGDHVVTASGQSRRIKWLGRRTYGGRFIGGRKDILPICITAGALADNVPKRDLWISPHHAMYIDGMLIEAKDLLNGTSVVQVAHAERVDYFHIELESHDVLVAEGAASESYIDDDSRGMFHNAHEFAMLYPDAEEQLAVYCAPRVEEGLPLEKVRRAMRLRGEELTASCGNGSKYLRAV